MEGGKYFLMRIVENILWQVDRWLLVKTPTTANRNGLSQKKFKI